MPFERPPLQTLISRIAADLESRLTGADAKLRRRLLTGLGRAQAGAAHGLHGHLEWISEQILPDQADEEILSRHGALWGIPRKQAERAGGNVVLTGTTGTVIPAGTELQRSDGVVFTTSVDATLVAGTATVGVVAEAVGIDGNTASGTTLNLVSPIKGCNDVATVDVDGITDGLDIEAAESWRARIVARIQAPPHGGRAEDYEIWALEVAGVTRVWVSPLHLGVGTVGIFIVCDDQAGSIIPDAAKVQEVQDYIEALRPVTAQVSVFAPTPVPLDMTISLIPDTAAVRAAVQAELEDLLRREAEPGGTILLSHLREAISLAAGETDHVLTVPGADVDHAAGELAVLGDITWA